jgi:diguanylate cyclase (GGDEF)-like protein/PAS domain S-box-containing protein
MTRDSSPPPDLSSAQILEVIDSIASLARSEVDLNTLLHNAAETVRQLMQTDRVVIYRFLPDNDAVVAVESIAHGWQPLLGELIYDPCFENGWAERYRQGHISSVNDVENSSLEPCYIDLLTSLQVRANLVVPVFCSADLWGLFIAHHCSAPRSWQPLDIQLMQQSANQLGQAIQQHRLQQQLQEIQQTLQFRLNDSLQHLQTLATQEANRARQESEELFRLVTQNIEQFLFVRDAKTGHFLYVSPAYERIWHRSCESLYENQHSWLESVYLEDLSQVQTSLGQQFTGQPMIRDYRIRRPNGELRWIHTQVHVVPDANQEPFQFVGWAEDCTERKQLELTLQATQKQLNTILDSAIAAISYIRVYPEGHYLLDYQSAGSETIFGFTAEEFLADQTLWNRQVHIEDYQRTLDEILNIARAEQTAAVEYRFWTKAGDLRWIEETLISQWDEDANCWRATVLALDITARKNAELALNYRLSQERRLRTITAHIRETLEFETIVATTEAEVSRIFEADRVVICQKTPANFLQIVYQISQSPYSRITPEQLSVELIPPSHVERFIQGRPHLIHNITAEPWHPDLVEILQEFDIKALMLAPIVQARNELTDTVWGLLIVHACGGPRHWQPFEADMLQHIADHLAIAVHQSQLYKQLQQANQSLEALSNTDSLTQLSNRRRFDDYLNQEWQRLLRHQAPLSLILADVDYFKPYNDTYGHHAGDGCLAQIADAIREAIQRPADLAARYGGEEFAIILPHTDRTGALHIVQAVQYHLRTKQIVHRASSIENYVTLSFGIAVVIPTADSSPYTLIQAADQALYTAKGKGRNQYHVAEPVYGEEE